MRGVYVTFANSGTSMHMTTCMNITCIVKRKANQQTTNNNGKYTLNESIYWVKAKLSENNRKLIFLSATTILK